MTYTPIVIPAELSNEEEGFAEQVKKKASDLRDALVKQTLADAESWAKAIDDEWYKANPDSRYAIPRSQRGGGSPIPAEEMAAFRHAVETEYYEWIAPKFKACLGPDPAASEPARQALFDIQARFLGGVRSKSGKSDTIPVYADADLSLVSSIRTEMEANWEGDLQTNFVAHFARPLGRIVPHMGFAAEAALEIFTANAELYIRYRQKILELLTKSIEAVKSLNKGRDPKPYTIMTLVGISIGTILTVNPATAVAGAAIVTVSTMAQAGTPTEPTENELSAPTAQEISYNVDTALNGILHELYKSEWEVRRAFEACSDAISNARSSALASNIEGPFSVATPNVSTVSAANITDGSLRRRE